VERGVPRETGAFRAAHWHGFLPSLLGARRVKQPVTDTPCRLDLSLPGTADLHPPPLFSSCFPTSPEFRYAGKYHCLFSDWSVGVPAPCSSTWLIEIITAYTPTKHRLIDARLNCRTTLFLLSLGEAKKVSEQRLKTNVLFKTFSGYIMYGLCVKMLDHCKNYFLITPFNWHISSGTIEIF